MLNVYAVEKKLKAFDSRANKTQKQEVWESWKHKQSPEWLQNYRRRVEKFVVDVDENSEDYESLLGPNRTNPATTASRNDKCLEHAHFIFRPYKSEKERVKESIEKNKFLQTEPIACAVYAHNFRDRDHSKELNGDMRFSSDPSRGLRNVSKGNFTLIRNPSSQLTPGISENGKDVKLYFKSTLSMLLKLGVLESRLPTLNGIEENAALRYERLADENRRKRNFDAKKKAGKKEEDDDISAPAGNNDAKQSQDEYLMETGDKRVELMSKEEALKLARKLLMKAMSITGFCYLPKIAKRSDPILVAAEKVLVKTNYIHKIRHFKRRMGENRYKGYVPPVNALKLSKKLHL